MTSEFQRAKAWREKRKWTVKDLSDRTGFSVESIYKFEQGFVVYGDKRKKIEVNAWQRFKMACAGADSLRRGRVFEWA